MATKPVIKNLNATSVGILNYILAGESGYLAGAPAVENTPQSIAQIGEYINAYQPRQNQFLSALVNRIGMVLIASKSYKNPWAWAKRGQLDVGEAIEEIYVNLAKIEKFGADNTTNQTLADLFGTRKPDVQAAFHQMNFQKKYPVTVSEDQLRTAFTSMSGVVDLIAYIVESLYTAFEYDEFLMYKYMLYRLALDGKLYVEKIPEVSNISTANAKKLVSQVKALSNNLTFLKTDYNMAHVYTHTPKADQMVIKDTELDAVLDVEVLASAFNMSKAEFSGNQVLIDGFGAPELKRLALILFDDATATSSVFTDAELTSIGTIKGFILDRDFLMQYEKLVKMTEQTIPNELKWNYFLHHWALFSASPFKNAIVLTTSNSSVNSVTTTPEAFEATPGASVQLTTVVGTSGFADDNVTYASGDTSVATVDRNGLVTIVSGASAGDTCTITVTAVGDTSKTDTVSVTVAGSTT